MTNWRVSETWLPTKAIVYGKRTKADTSYRVFEDRDEAFSVYRQLVAESNARFTGFGGQPKNHRFSISATSERVTDGWINPKGIELAKKKAARAKKRRELVKALKAKETK